MCNFRVGQKVACVNDQWSGNGYERSRGIGCPLKAGSTYTVSGFCVVDAFSMNGIFERVQCLLLAEVGHPSGRGFDARRFRPVVERGTETGMSILRELLNKTDKPVEVVS